MFNAKNNKNKIEAKDVLAAKAYGPELELQFIEQQKLLKKQLLQFTCEKCNTAIQVNEGKRKYTCPNKECQARHSVQFLYPVVETSIDNTYQVDSMQPIAPLLSDDLNIPTVVPTFLEYAYESRNYPAAQCTIEQLCYRIDKMFESNRRNMATRPTTSKLDNSGKPIRQLPAGRDMKAWDLLQDLFELIKKGLKE